MKVIFPGDLGKSGSLGKGGSPLLAAKMSKRNRFLANVLLDRCLGVDPNEMVVALY